MQPFGRGSGAAVGALHWNSPAVVVVERHDGRAEELAFETRLAAETYVGLIPWLQESGDEDAVTIRAAIIRAAAVGLN